MLTVEWNQKQECVEVYTDAEGLTKLIGELLSVQKYGGHAHLKTPSWAGDELSETIQGQDNKIINHLVIVLKPDE